MARKQGRSKGKKSYKKKKLWKEGASRYNYPGMTKNKPTKLINFGPIFMPDEFKTKLSYKESFRFTLSSGGIIGTNLFNGNSPRDPAAASGGKYAAGFADLSNIYQRYRVEASSIKVMAVSVGDTPSTSTYELAIFPTTLDPTAVGTISPQTAGAQPYGKYLVSSSWNARPLILKQFVTTAGIYGVPRIAVESEDDYGSDKASDPVNPWLWVVKTRSYASDNAIAISFTANIVYYVTFHSRDYIPD